MLGVFTGLTASIMTMVEENLTEWKKDTADHLIGGSDNNVGSAYAFFTCFSMALIAISSTATVYYGPGANGSGVAEIIGFMNGVNYPNIFTFETFMTKVFGVVFAVVGGLCVGKEGPLAHIGAIIGVSVLYFPVPGFEWFRNDVNKRELIAAGVSAGVSAAFGAPIGGTLFAYEVSKPNTFWRFSVIWKVFFSCALSVFSLAIFNSLRLGNGALDVNSAVLKFGDISVTSPTLEQLPSSFINGALCGLLGAAFVSVNTYINIARKSIITKQWARPLEAVFFSFLTTTAFFWAPYFFEQCKPSATVVTEPELLV